MTLHMVKSLIALMEVSNIIFSWISFNKTIWYPYMEKLNEFTTLAIDLPVIEIVIYSVNQIYTNGRKNL